MSEISRARERIMNKRDRGQEGQQRQSNDRNYPRKFTVSSLTHHFQSRPSPQPLNSPYAALSRQTTQLKIGESIVGSRAQRGTLSRIKENVNPMIKTINIKIQEMSRLSVSQEDNEDWVQSRYVDSPPKVSYRQTLHGGKPQLLMAPLPSRRHLSPYKPRECLRQWADGMLVAKGSGRPFIDDYFPPARTIIFSRNILCQQENLKFQRLGRIFQNSTISLLNTCEPTYLHPGKYTNTYLYSALVILAETPRHLLALFGGQEFNQQGAYHVCICKDGVWRYVVVDDFMPIKINGGRKQMLFLRSRQVESEVQLWPGLIEKAVAKVYGTYVDLKMSYNQGMADLFKLLTGAPASSYLLNKDFRSFLIIVDAALKRGHVVTLQAAREEQSQTAQLKNLKLHHAYRVLQIRKSGLRIRNYAQAQLQTKLRFDECLIFTRLVIYRTEPNFRYITHKLRHKLHFFSKLSLTVPVATRAYFDVWQNNTAYYKKYMGENIQYQPSRFKMLLTRGQEDGIWLEAGKDVEIAEGQYELYVHLCQEKEYDFTLSYYGEKDVKLERIKSMEEWGEPCLCPKK